MQHLDYAYQEQEKRFYLTPGKTKLGNLFPSKVSKHIRLQITLATKYLNDFKPQLKKYVRTQYEKQRLKEKQTLKFTFCAVIFEKI